MTAYVRNLTRADIDHLAENLRSNDVAELDAQSGLTPRKALEMALVFAKECRVISDDNDVPIGVYGVSDTNIKGLGSIWMMATPDLLKHQRQFLRECREGISDISQGYSCVFNYTDARNTVHHKWLKWCGFTFINKREEFGRNGETFYEFVKIL
jgi:hypothetical protein